MKTLAAFLLGSRLLLLRASKPPGKLPELQRGSLSKKPLQLKTQWTESPPGIRGAGWGQRAGGRVPGSVTSTPPNHDAKYSK